MGQSFVSRNEKKQIDHHWNQFLACLYSQAYILKLKKCWGLNLLDFYEYNLSIKLNPVLENMKETMCDCLIEKLFSMWMQKCSHPELFCKIWPTDQTSEYFFFWSGQELFRSPHKNSLNSFGICEIGLSINFDRSQSWVI